MTIRAVPATVLRVTDADTLVALLDLGWHITLQAKVRVAGIDSPELTTPEGKAARDFSARLLPPGTHVTVISRSLDKYGRVLGAIALPDGRDYGQTLIGAGHARPYT